ncbi:MAG TPA: sulfotransferase [Myxococcota bacterium]|nr:sulfotransferase [Myxococcota bacterium]
MAPLVDTISRPAGLADRYVRSYLRSRTYREIFERVHTYCMFVGYPRSGHSLVGSLLDAHPHAIVAHELHALRYIRYRFSRDQLFWLLLENSREFTGKGRVWTGYSYLVPGQWQGHFSDLRVIGDKRGGASVRELRRRPWLLKELRERVALPLKFIHVVRNPYDNIATMHAKSPKGRPLEVAFEHYLGMTRGIVELKRHLSKDEVLDLRHEDLVADPQFRLQALCRFLGLDPDMGYLCACASIVFCVPHRTRHGVHWTRDLLARAEREFSQLSFLSGYSFET